MDKVRAQLQEVDRGLAELVSIPVDKVRAC